MSSEAPRAKVLVKQQDSDALKVTTYLEHWHEKTLLLGLKVNRDQDECTSTSECELTKELYVMSMQYDGKVDWGGSTWGGAQLNVRMGRFAHVYTRVPPASIWEVLASCGGASAWLISALAVPLAMAERLHARLKKRRELHVAPETVIG